MEQKKYYGALDCFRVVAALLVIANHTAPLASFDTTADFILTRIFARLAVPFFFMVSGYFLLPQYLFAKKQSVTPLLSFLKKLAILYGIAILIYLPISIYANQYQELTVVTIMRNLFFDGPFYHLWYFPAVMLGVLLLYFLAQSFSPRILMGICGILYLIGLGGDSYFGFVQQSPVLSAFYNALFQLLSYTRNGLFFAPLFLALGAQMSQRKRLNNRNKTRVVFFIALLGMVIEGLLLRRLGWQRHDSMYLLLPLVMYLLFELLLTSKVQSTRYLRPLSTWMYLLHPLVIIGIRGIAKLLGITALLVENSMIRYLSVSLITTVLAYIIVYLFYLSIVQYKKDRAWIELDRAALRHNVEVLKAIVPQGCELMPALKANAYGHGAVLIGRELNTLGVKAFCVATVTEAVELRKGGIKGAILILGYTDPAQFPLLRRYHLIQTVTDCAYGKLLNSYGKRIAVHIAIDTGMHRLGERSERIEEIAELFQYKHLAIKAVYTHFCADDTQKTTDKVFTMQQAETFQNTVARLKELGCVIPKTHSMSSYSLLNYPTLTSDYARIGIALYGVLSTKEDTECCPIELKPVLTLKARVALVKEIYQNEAAGYGLCYTAKRDGKLAVLTIGYADGVPRTLSCGKGKALINGQKATIIGRICMDQLLVDVTDIPEVKSGDVAILIGQSGKCNISASDMANCADTIANEILSRLGARLTRTMQ